MVVLDRACMLSQKMLEVCITSLPPWGNRDISISRTIACRVTCHANPFNLQSANVSVIVSYTLLCCGLCFSIQGAFFDRYKKGGYYSYEAEGQQPMMLKVKDWPPDDEFKQRLVRHNQVRVGLREQRRENPVSFYG